MRKFDTIIALITAGFLITCIWLAVLFNRMGQNPGIEYKVEINRIYSRLSQLPAGKKTDLSEYRYIKKLEYMPVDYNNNLYRATSFFNSKNGMSYEIRPWYQQNKLVGYVRFDYETGYQDKGSFFKIELLIFVFGIVIVSILVYVRNSIIKPFNSLSEVPYELSKGNLKEAVKENKNKYFGKFVWGINVLRENLDYHKIKELKLEKDKKLLLLSISHDIKTPLNTIKLYAKAIEEQVYDTDEKKIKAAKHIQQKSLEIENFVKEIIKTSSEDILEIEVNNGEFYLKDLVNKVIAAYKEKCNLKLIDFVVEDYSNKLIKGDKDRVLEVIGNIIENAMKYGDGKEIRISFYEEDYCQLIKIWNSGETIKENEFNHIFDSFFRASNSKDKPGNGLGLYICKAIMEKMDGEIFAECEEDGMSFTLVLR